MNDEMMKYFVVIGKVQSAISKTDTLIDALKEGINTIIDAFPSDYAILWYMDKENKQLRPYYWVGSMDFTAKSHGLGEGVVGRVFESQKSERVFEYKQGDDEATDADFNGIDISSMICVPFSNAYEDLGCIQLVRVKEHYNDEIADVCEILANMIAIAIDENEKIPTDWNFGNVILSVRDIKKTFVNGDIETPVLKGVNLDVYEGEFLVILGESGCGKSTFLNVIAGMDSADSGSFTFMGKEMTGISQEECTVFRRDNIGFIFQSYNLMPNLTAKQNLDLIAELVKDPMDSDEALELVGLSDRKNNYPSQMSGGQQQRVSIARALIKKPKMIFADEPTAALDYTTSIEVLSVLEKVIHTGSTLVMVTHNEEITRMADRVVRMRNGKVHEISINRHPVPATDLVW